MRGRGPFRRIFPPALPAAILVLSLIVVAGRATAADFPLAPGQTMVGSVAVYLTRPHDTLLDIAVEADLGYTQIVAANKHVNPWLPGVGRRIVIPTAYVLPDVPHKGIVVNLAQQRLFYFPPGGGSVQTFPIGIAVEGRSTPLGVTRVLAKQAEPAWYPTPSMREEDPTLPKMVPAGSDNPLGAYALLLGWSGYLIHGTNNPYGVGRMVSHGCIRLYPADIAMLYGEVSVGTPVRVVNEPVEVAWSHGGLYVAAFPDVNQTAAIDGEQRFTPAIPANLVSMVLTAAGDQTARIDWQALTRAGMERTGIPVCVISPPGKGARAEIGRAGH